MDSPLRSLAVVFCALCLAAAPALAQKSAPPGAATGQPQPGAAAKQAAPTPAAVLDSLYAKLAKTTDATEAHGILMSIEQAHMLSGSPTSDLLMDRAMTAMRGQNPKLALDLLDQIVAFDPDWAEGWNKRATVRFEQNDDTGSMNDISRVLALDPRHVGALSGMGGIMQRNGYDKGALAAFKRVQELFPAQEGLGKMIEKLTGEVEGRGI